MSNQNLFSALRAAFPSDLDSTAVETTAADGSPAVLHLARPGPGQRPHRQPARIAQAARRQPRGRAGRKICRSHGPVPGHAARGLRVLAAQHRLPKRRDRILHRQRRARRGGVQPRQLWLGQQNRLHPGHAACVHPGGRPHRQPARSCRPPRRRAPGRSPQRRRPGRHPLHQRHHRPQQGRHAHARQHAQQRCHAQRLLGLDGYRRA